MASDGVSSSRTLVASTSRGPRRWMDDIASKRSRRLRTVFPVRYSSSNMLGVTMSAARIASVRMNSGMPGRTNTPESTSPMTGSQQ